MFDTASAVLQAERVDALIRGEHRLRVELLDELAALEAEGSWEADGARTLPEWLVARYAVSIGTAREWLRVARALAGLPRIRETYVTGGLSWDQLRALVKVADVETDAEWARRAPGMTVAELRAAHVRMTKDDAAVAHEDRNVRWWFNPDKPGFHMTVQMGDTEGAALATWLTRRANQYPADPETGFHDFFEARCADALHELAANALANDPDLDRATVLVLAPLDTLLDGTGTATLADGPAIASDTLRRLVCDARIQLAITDPDHGPVGVGRTARTVPPWLNRLVRARDRGCRFPGCHRTRFTHAHHLVHWADGGPTDLDNLVTLCSYHHRLVHEHGWQVTGNPTRLLTWRHSCGYVFKPLPPYHDPEMMRRVFNPMRNLVEPPDRLPMNDPMLN